MKSLAKYRGLVDGFLRTEGADPVQRIKYCLEYEDPESEERIADGISTNRQGWCRIAVRDSSGQPVKKADIEIVQRKHEFRFGCNAFMLNGCGSAEANSVYETSFKKVFNHAVIPFYWSDLEPTEGTVRFGKDSEFIHRRPPPDVVLDWCEKNGIVPKGHPLLWHLWFPKWAPKDKKEVERLCRRRFRQIAERYGERIKEFDVINEALAMNPMREHDAVLPDDPIVWAFREVARVFPADCKLNYNEVTSFSWEPNNTEISPMYLLLKDIIARGAAVSGIGLQYHLFNPVENVATRGLKLLSSVHLLDVMDRYATLGIPMNISEITLPAYSDIKGGEDLQELMLRKLFRLWFSHSHVDGIVWWNLHDGGAVLAADGSVGENRWNGGLMRSDFAPKPAYETLDRFVNKEWMTNETVQAENGVAWFKGFFGSYDVKASYSGGQKTTTLVLSKNSPNEIELVV